MQTVEYLWRDVRSDLRSKTVLRDEVSRSAPAEVICGPLMFENVSLATPDVYLGPVRTYTDPFRASGRLALCDVFRDVHLRNCLNNERSALQKFMLDRGSIHDPLVGLEQSVILSGDQPDVDMGFYGRMARTRTHMDIFEAFVSACAHVGLCVHSVMWGENPNSIVFSLRGDPVDVADDLLVARWILQRVCRARDVDMYMRELPDYAEEMGVDIRLGVTLSTILTRGPASAAGLLAVRDALGEGADIPHASKYADAPFVRVHDAPAASDPYTLLLDILTKTCASRVQVVDVVGVTS
jgi:hypothetical protein